MVSAPNAAFWRENLFAARFSAAASAILLAWNACGRDARFLVLQVASGSKPGGPLQGAAAVARLNALLQCALLVQQRPRYALLRYY